MKFRKKPVVIEAMQWSPVVDPDGAAEVAGWLGFNGLVVTHLTNGELLIPTLEDGSENQAKHVASPGDWIIRGVQGEFYPCKPDIFEQTYEEVA